MRHPSLVLAGLLALAGCGDPAPTAPAPGDDPTAAAAAFEKDLRTRLATAEPGDVIEIPAGTHPMTRSLVLNASGVTIRGAGMNETVLSFAGQLAGAEGLLVNASDFVIEDLAIEDTIGDALKINEGRNITVRRVRTEWTRGPSTDNGAYGIYPVQTENTLVEDSIAIAASDAGIYVGQSRNVVVRNNTARLNVAGIEIENTVGADVYGNLATENTGGILVFNMPDLPMAGHSTRVFDNRIVANNTDNFGEPGSAVAGVPAGSGVVINSNDDVEIFGNEIADNDTANILISSFFSSGLGDRPQAEGFDPWPERIWIHDNAFAGGGTSPDMVELQALRVAVFGLDGALPPILWDGYVNPDIAIDGRLPPEHAICIAGEGAGIVNVDGPGDYANVSVDPAPHQCTHAGLAPIVLPQLADEASPGAADAPEAASGGE